MSCFFRLLGLIRICYRIRKTGINLISVGNQRVLHIKSINVECLCTMYRLHQEAMTMMIVNSASFEDARKEIMENLNPFR